MANVPQRTGAGTSGSTGGLFPDIKTFFFYGISALALIALANYMPKVAIMFAFLLIAGVLLTHWSDYAGYLQVPSSGG